MAQDAGAKPGSVVKVKRGLTLSVSLLTPLDSAHTTVGQDVSAKLVRPLIADGAVVLPIDWIVHGTVVKVKRASKNCHDGTTEWKLKFVTTSHGEQIRVQPIYSYPFDPNQVGDPEWVPLQTPLKKILRVPVFIGEAAGALALSPVLIPMAIAVTEPCHGREGHDQLLQAGRTYLFAVSTDTRVVP